jgi:hypothetical protein
VAEPGQVVEQRGDVLCDLGISREQAQILVRARRDGVVVARADVDVPAQAVPFRRTTSVIFACTFRSEKP